MRIAIIHHQFKLRGGMETYLFDLITGFNAHQDQVTVFVYRKDQVESSLCTVKQTYLFWLPRVLRKFWFGYRINQRAAMRQFDLRISLMRSLNQEVIVCGGTHRGYLNFIEKKPKLSDNWEVAREEKSYQSSGYIIAHSQMLKDELVSLYGVDPKKITVLYPPVDIEKFNRKRLDQRLEFRNKYQIHPEKKAILFVSTGHKRKGFNLLVEAFKLLPTEDFELVVAGNRPIENSLSNINYVGFISDMAALYIACDVTVLPSKYEPFGLVVIESVQCGTPVIISKMVGAKDLISGEEGIILEDFSPNNLANAILQATQKKYDIDPDFAKNKGLTVAEHIADIKKITIKDHYEKKTTR